jgi:acetyltransferase-like isoleucine patch superfamily enzyme
MKEIDKGTIYRDKIIESRQSPLRNYMYLTVGHVGFAQFFLYESLTCLLGPLPGGIGFYLRKIFYPHLFKKTGKGLIIGRNVVIRHPDKIEIGDNVTIDDNCLIDARGAGTEGLVLEDGVIVNRNCMLQAKSGSIRLGCRTSLGSNSVIVSLSGVYFGEAVLTAGGIYVSAGAYHFSDTSTPVMDQGAYTKGPIKIGSNSWLGTCAIVLDGITIGDGAVIGAGSVVTRSISDNCIAVGVPAKVVGEKKAENNSASR